MKSRILTAAALAVAAMMPASAFAGAITADALAARLATTISVSETVGTNAKYPRANIVNFVLKGMWQDFYELQPSLEVERSAVDKVAGDTALTSIQRESIARMRKELAFD